MSVDCNLHRVRLARGQPVSRSRARSSSPIGRFAKQRNVDQGRKPEQRGGSGPALVAAVLWESVPATRLRRRISSRGGDGQSSGQRAQGNLLGVGSRRSLAEGEARVLVSCSALLKPWRSSANEHSPRLQAKSDNSPPTA
jgi:hypothetical protein